MKVLITGAWQCSEEEITEIKKLGNEVFFQEDERASLSVDYSEVEAVICNGLFLYHPIERFTALKYIQLTSVGFDRVPMDYIEEHGITIFNAGDTYSIPMAEYAIWGVLQLYKRTSFFIENQESGNWKKHRNILELHGKRVCIIGCGNVGAECAKRFRAFGCEIIGIDKFIKEREFFDEIVPLDKTDTQLSKADIIILSVPLNQETKHFMNRERIKILKETAIIVNISRGQIVEESALVGEIKNIGGAVLDVFEQEPLSENSPLWNLENVIITPHNSFIGEGNKRRLFKIIIKNLLGDSSK